MENTRRLIRREDTVSRNKVIASLTTKKDITPNAWTTIISVTITPKNQNRLIIRATVSAYINSPYGYGIVRLSWKQGEGGTSNVIEESKGIISPLATEEYSRIIEIENENLTLGKAVEITLEGQAVGKNLIIEPTNAYLMCEEW